MVVHIAHSRRAYIPLSLVRPKRAYQDSETAALMNHESRIMRQCRVRCVRLRLFSSPLVHPPNSLRGTRVDYQGARLKVPSSPENKCLADSDALLLYITIKNGKK